MGLSGIDNTRFGRSGRVVLFRQLQEREHAHLAPLQRQNDRGFGLIYRAIGGTRIAERVAGRRNGDALGLTCDQPATKERRAAHAQPLAQDRERAGARQTAGEPHRSRRLPLAGFGERRLFGGNVGAADGG